jgi:polyhydroxybutyrate depolymerase
MESKMHRYAILIFLSCFLSTLGHGQVITFGSLQVDGLTRTYTLRTPKGYPANRSYPLMLLLHGRFGTGMSILEYTDMGKLADEEGFIVLCPDGYKKSWNDGRADTPAHQAGVDDVAFLSALLTKFCMNPRVIDRRIHCVGMSNGGFMALKLGSRLGGRLTSISVVAASVPEANPESHLPIGKMPLLILNGTEDPLIKYEGGPISRRSPERILATPAFAARYASDLGCTQISTRDQADIQNDGTSTTVMTWSACEYPSELQLWTVKGGGHTWPGKKRYMSQRLVGRTSQDFDGNRVIWEFASRFIGPE